MVEAQAVSKEAPSAAARVSWSALILTVVAGVLLLALGLPQLFYPWWFDQGAFAACAQVLLRGGAMYRDCFEVRGPLMAFWYALPMALSPQSMWPLATHAFDLLSAALTAILIGLIAREWFEREYDHPERPDYLPRDASFAPFVASALYWLMYVSLNYWSTGQAEGVANLLVVAAIWLVGRGEWRAPIKDDSDAVHRPKRLVSFKSIFIAGLCSGLTLWLKYPFVVIALLIAVVLFFSLRGRRFLAFAVGLLIAIGLGLAYLWLSGAWLDWQMHLAYDWATFHDIPLDERLEWLRGLFVTEVLAFIQQGSTPTAGFKDTVPQVMVLGRGFPLIFALAALSLRKLFSRNPARRGTFFALAYFLVAVGLNIWQGHSYRYHFIVALPGLALLAAASLRSERTFMQFLTGLLSIGALVGLIAAVWPWVRDAYDNALVQGKTPRQIQLESKEADYLRIADFLQQNTQPDEAIVIYSDVPAVYPLANRANGTRFPYLRWFDEGRSAFAADYYEARFLDDLNYSKPKFFVITKDGYPWPEARFGETLKRMNAVDAYVHTYYDYATDIGPFVVFKRK